MNFFGIYSKLFNLCKTLVSLHEFAKKIRLHMILFLFFERNFVEFLVFIVSMNFLPRFFQAI